MTSDAFLRLLLCALDDVDRVFDHRDVAEWPPGTLTAAERLGLVRPASGGLTAACPHCEEAHVEVVAKRAGPDGVDRLWIYCPEDLRVEVTAEMCRGWQVHPHGFAAAVAGALALTPAPVAIVSDRLWRLGRIPWQGKTREVLVARRLQDPDAASVAAHVGAGGRAVLLVPHHAPDDRIWKGRVPAAISLSRIASFVEGQFVLDGAALVSLVAEADEVAEQRSLLPTDPEVKKRVVRQQVKAEIKGHLQDDVLVAARKTFGSTRKAAAELTKQLGRPVSKDQVQRAIDRSGGLEALIDQDDSGSVDRRVASQSRDRAKKISQRR